MEDITYSVKQRSDRNFNWYAYYRDSSGKQRQKKIPGTTPNTPEIKAFSAGNQAVRNWLAKSVPKEDPGSDRLLRVEFERFLKLVHGFKKPATREAIGYACDVFFKHFSSPKLRDFTRDEANRIAAVVMGTGIATKYYRNVLGDLKGFFNWCVSEKLVLESPVVHLKAPTNTEKKEEEIWSDEEYQKTSEQLRSDDRFWFKLMRYTGMYPSDIFAFRKKHVIKGAKGEWKINKLREKAKYPTERINQPLLPQVKAEIMLAYLAKENAEDKLFVDSDCTARTWRVNMKKRIKRAYKKAFPKRKAKNIKSLRHTFATWLMENDIPIDVAKEWMGHSKNSMTLNAVYLHRESSVQYVQRLSGV